jgi:hypothetical protein
VWTAPCWAARWAVSSRQGLRLGWGYRWARPPYPALCRCAATKSGSGGSAPLSSPRLALANRWRLGFSCGAFGDQHTTTMSPSSAPGPNGCSVAATAAAVAKGAAVRPGRPPLSFFLCDFSGLLGKSTTWPFALSAGHPSRQCSVRQIIAYQLLRASHRAGGDERVQALSDKWRPHLL